MYLRIEERDGYLAVPSILGSHPLVDGSAVPTETGEPSLERHAGPEDLLSLRLPVDHSMHRRVASQPATSIGDIWDSGVPTVNLGDSLLHEHADPPVADLVDVHQQVDVAVDLGLAEKLKV